jgi:hypothetical protein
MRIHDAGRYGDGVFSSSVLLYLFLCALSGSEYHQGVEPGCNI